MEEYKEFMERNKKVKYATSSIETIEVDGDELYLSLDDFGIDLLSDKPKQKESKNDLTAALNEFDFTF